MGLKVMFWNINGRGNSFVNKLLSVSEDVDILLLAESRIDDSIIKEKIKLNRVLFKSEFDEINLTPKLYSNISPGILEHYSNAPSKRLCFFTLQTKEFGEIILAGLHFPSKATYNGETQLSFASNYSKWIKEIEEQRNHKRTLVFGDFNMNPFEEGMIQPQAFNATLSAEVAKSGQRTSHYEKFDYFYNPMWNWLGDREYHSGRNKLAGSFYYKTTSDATQIYWNVFDKVIVRPQLIDAIDYSSLKIIEALPMVEFILQGSKNKADNLVDHLPLLFTLNVSTK